MELRDGQTLRIEPGDAFMIPAGHDAYVLGDEPFVMVQFDEGESAAQPVQPAGLAKAA